MSRGAKGAFAAVTVGNQKPWLGKECASRRNQSIQDQLAIELLCVCKAALGRYGMSAKRISKLVHEVDELSNQTPIAERLFFDLNSLGELANEWAENYVDASGRPRIIPIIGRGNTFASLVRKYFGARRLNEILKLACSTRVIETLGANKVAQLNAGVMLTGKPVLLLARAILSVRWLLATAENNGREASGNVNFWPERLACGVVSDKCFSEFAEMMRPQIANLANMSNRWLAKHAVTGIRGNKNQKTKFVGLHAYVFRD